MKKSYLWIIYRRTKFVWKDHLFFWPKLYMKNCVYNFLNNYYDIMNNVKNKIEYYYCLPTLFLKIISVSCCENAYNNDIEPTYNLKKKKKKNVISGNKNFHKLAGYEHFSFEVVLYYIKQTVTFLVYFLIHFYLFFYNTFYYMTSNIITKSFLEISNEKYCYSTSIPNNLFNSFVTIYKMYEKNNSLDFKFKVDHMAFLGSGFIYDKQGYILTAAHNITNSADTFVIKNNDDFYFATVSGLHKDSDICVMKINSEEQFSHISLDSRREDLKQGEPVIAYGQIQNFDKETYSIGVVNQPKQTFSKFENFNENKKACLYPFIQISNPINKGMSGSPLIDRHGNLVGMIQKKIDNYGLALPSHILKNIALCLQHRGTYEEPFLGIILKGEELSTKNNQNNKRELKIYDVLVNSPAHTSGLKKEDILLKINNLNINHICQIHEILNSTCDGYINVEVVRHKKKLKIKVKL
ncbi:trypsin-like serine protease, putative [Plasmodium malariae]|uniref:Trypsin-like serine protease, putative n=1 Tax=Plasmodium malariae TaxID=5858 RepID=A0A1C3L2L7_PLAMA|nr:trypsin-like serine protease, putative [Plasmodium malariae]